MTNDPLVYVGDTATLSFLQRIRVMVETTKGSSLFMQDPARHFLTENALSLAPSVKTTHMLPERQTSLVLLASFFDNVSSHRHSLYEPLMRRIDQ